jgi:cytochrome c
MSDQPRIQPSLWVAIGLVGFLFTGGAVSLAVQGWQSRTQLQTAASEMTGGDAQRGEAIFGQAGCGACHQIQGVDRADGAVGPPLSKISSRAFLAGRLANNPANLILWIRHPQSVDPGNGMPDPPLNDQQTRDVAAYLYTLK